MDRVGLAPAPAESKSQHQPAESHAGPSEPVAVPMVKSPGRGGGARRQRHGHDLKSGAVQVRPVGKLHVMHRTKPIDPAAQSIVGAADERPVVLHGAEGGVGARGYGTL